MTYGLHHTCCIAFMRTLPAACIHLIICDSPYENTDLAFDKQPVDWVAWWAEAKRVLVPTGIVICFAAELFTLDLIASNRPWYRYRMVWAKSKSTRSLDKSWRPLCGHEDIVLFAPKPKEATYNPQKLLRRGKADKSVSHENRKMPHYKHTKAGNTYVDDGTRYPTTIKEYPSVGTTASHYNPTAKPLALIQEFVLTFSDYGDVVFEPFAGDAPAAHACENTGRRYIGCEKDQLQHDWSKAHLAKKSPLFHQTNE